MKGEVGRDGSDFVDVDGLLCKVSGTRSSKHRIVVPDCELRMELI